MSDVSSRELELVEQAIPLFNGAFLFHPKEPFVYVRGDLYPFGLRQTRVVQALAQPVGAYVDKSTLYERVWEEDFNPSLAVHERRLKKAVAQTRDSFIELLGPEHGRAAILTSAGAVTRYALYDPFTNKQR